MAIGWKGRYYGFTKVVADYTTPQTNAVLVAATGVGKYIEVAYLEYSSDTLGQFQLKSDGTDKISCTKYLPAFSGVCIDDANYHCENNAALTFTSNITGNHSIMVYYYVRQG